MIEEVVEEEGGTEIGMIGVEEDVTVVMMIEEAETVIETTEVGVEIEITVVGVIEMIAGAGEIAVVIEEEEMTRHLDVTVIVKLKLGY
mmetsp:Transcript_32580/g.33229  ORF Transcript_32580/g.33229 Transcript_32580/m.33229 type:complete len:88 (+) Transcript_32580:490-753(+)